MGRDRLLFSRLCGGLVLGLAATSCAGDLADEGDLPAQIEPLAACPPAFAVKAYVGGARVSNRGKIYECKPYPHSGWCGIGAAYEPGVGSAWRDAWIEIGPCGVADPDDPEDPPPDDPPPDDPADDPSADGFTHPGLLSTSPELARIRANVRGAASHPMKDGWNKLRSTRFASLSYAATPFRIVHVVGSGSNAEERAMRNDAVAAYAHALEWAVTRDGRHSRKAIDIMRAWSTTLTDVVPTAGSPGVQDKLEVAWYAPIWLAAAEIIRHHDGGSAGWSSTDRARFDTMVRLFKQKADAWGGSNGCCPNQALSVQFSRMSIGVYTGDRSYFRAAVDRFKNTVLPRAIAQSGEVLEINRMDGGDCGHASYNIEAIFDIAEVAWHQGVDLYGDARLPKGLEYLAQCIVSGVQTSQEGFVHCASMRPSSIEIAANHYRSRRGSPALPRTDGLLRLVRPADQGTGKFIPWDTLTHAELK
jgi:hypothetical protein